MAYVPPTPSQIKTRYSEFSSVSDVLIGLMISEAGGYVSQSWVERDYQPAIMLLVCHWLTVEGELGRSNGGGGAAGLGAIKRRRVGDVETEFAGFGSSSGGGANASEYGSTVYGLRFLELMRLNFPAVAVV